VAQGTPHAVGPPRISFSDSLLNQTFEYMNGSLRLRQHGTVFLSQKIYVVNFFVKTI